jgi:hypothetical protein
VWFQPRKDLLVSLGEEVVLASHDAITGSISYNSRS